MPARDGNSLSSGGRGFDARQVRHQSIMEIDHEIFSRVILSLPLIQEGQLSFLAKECTQVLLRGLSLPRKSVVR